MQFIWICILFASLLHQNASGIDLARFLDTQPHVGDLPINSTTEENVSDGASSLDDSNSTEFQNGSISPEATSTEIDQGNSTLETKQPTVQSTDHVASSSTVMTTASSNESHSSNSTPGNESSSTGIASSSSSSTSEADGEEPEGVARGKPTIPEIGMNATTPKPETVFQKALHLINDTYTLSILLPIVAGVVFATSILLTIAMCRCLRRACRRRRLRRKALPDSVKNLRPSDRARLLAESSDEEF